MQPATNSTFPQREIFPGFANLPREVAADSDEFLIQQAGAGFAADLPAANCEANGELASFSPNWGEGSALDSAAYALYRLTFDPLQVPVTLKLDWIGQAPPECWIGFSDWQRNSWHWEPLPGDGELELSDPSRFVNAQQHSYAALVVLGQADCTLAKIGYGEPAIPAPGAGFTLFAPLNDRNTYLIDMDGTVVHSWTANRNAGATAKLLPNGHLLRAANLNNVNFLGGGSGGRLTEFDWDGNLVWYFDLSTSTQCTHHDFEVLPNGNILLIVWNSLTSEEAIGLGRDPDLVTSRFWPDSIIEVQPTGDSGGNIVWEWRLIDHLVQDFDPDKPNFGDPAEHPELVDVNYPPLPVIDWTHINCVAFNADLDQIMLSTPTFNEIWIIDHSTTIEEAAGHTGGRYGRGGDLLFRWGNPAAYRAGGFEDQKLYFQHDAHWIAEGLEGAGEVLIFNNRFGEGLGEVGSAAYQIRLPQNPDGSYYMDGPAFGPEGPSWLWTGVPLDSFFSSNLSASQRLPGGGTLVTSGAESKLFELDADGNVIWEFQNTLTPTLPVIFRALRYTYDYPGVAALQE